MVIQDEDGTWGMIWDSGVGLETSGRTRRSGANLRVAQSRQAGRLDWGRKGRGIGANLNGEQSDASGGGIHEHGGESNGAGVSPAAREGGE